MATFSSSWRWCAVDDHAHPSDAENPLDPVFPCQDVPGTNAGCQLHAPTCCDA